MPVTIDLGRVRRLAKHLGCPEASVARYIHIAGVNGKTSVALLLTRLLRRGTRLRLGTFIHPPPRRPNSAILIDEHPLDERHFVELWEHVNRTDALFFTACSFFEKLFMVALLAFREHGCHVLVIESAMGGTVDATNILGDEVGDGVISRQLAAIITNIGMDHPAYLGPTVEAITLNMMGIIKADKGNTVPVLTALSQPPQAQAVLLPVLAKIATVAFGIDDSALELVKKFTLSMAPEQQANNIELAVRAYKVVLPQLELFYGIRCSLDPDPRVFADLKVPGSFATHYYGGHQIIVDGAQNDASRLFPWMARLHGSVHCLMGLSNKDGGVLRSLIKATGMRPNLKYSLVAFKRPEGYPWIHPVEPSAIKNQFMLLANAEVSYPYPTLSAYGNLAEAFAKITEEVIILFGSPHIAHDFYNEFIYHNRL